MDSDSTEQSNKLILNYPESIHVSGWLVLDKPTGMSSARVGNIIKKRFNLRKIGHVGTLDPMATGVLTFAVNEATKLIPYCETQKAPHLRVKKEYVFDVSFGQATDTCDAEGVVIETCDHLPSQAQLIEICDSMHGPQKQTPPIYSAIKQGGQRLCDLARKDKHVIPPTREIFIHALEMISSTNKQGHQEQVIVARFRAIVSGGTYIRSLARDISLKANTLGVVTYLRRTKDSIFSISQSISLENLLDLAHKECMGRFLEPIGAVLGDIPVVSVSEQEFSGLLCGRAFKVSSHELSQIATIGEDSPCIVQILFGQMLVGMGSVAGGVCSPQRVLKAFESV
jgi:tRNA pseudouridine55 synthase